MLYGKSMFTRKQPLNYHEIHQYILDLERITLLRDKCTDTTEAGRYDTIIEVMQLCLEHLHENVPIKSAVVE